MRGITAGNRTHAVDFGAGNLPPALLCARRQIPIRGSPSIVAVAGAPLYILISGLALTKPVFNLLTYNPFKLRDAV